MRVETVANMADLSQRAAALVADLIKAKPTAVLGLPTGSTPIGLYAALSEMELSFATVHTFNLDEYRGLAPDHPQSYYAFMKAHLYDKTDLNPAFTHVPNGLAPDAEVECQRYEAAIHAAGGLDLVVLGLGHNGHIGFNEPGSPWNGPTHTVVLANDTRQANARFFGGLEAVPTEALTMGIGTILGARQILLLASGSRKSEAVHHLLEGEPTIDFPVTSLRSHRDITVLLDADAAGEATKVR
jgi:glucosamine-6-phosphate deaminase